MLVSLIPFGINMNERVIQKLQVGMETVFFFIGQTANASKPFGENKNG